MRKWKTLISGISGAVVLTALHQGFKNTMKDAPRVDILGMQAIKKILGKKAPKGKKLYAFSMLGDIVSNSWLYSRIAKTENPITTGAMVGISTGLSTAALPKSFGLSKNLSGGDFKTTLMTILYYTAGGLAAGGVSKLLKNA